MNETQSASDRAGVSTSLSSSTSSNLNGQSEYRFLVKCLRQVLTPSGIAKPIFTSQDEFSWARFLALAERHQVLPLVHAALDREGNSIPAEVSIWLRQRCRAIVAHNLSLASELIDVLKLFRERGITAISFKGPALAAALYGSLSLRQISDLDLFISRDRLEDSLTALRLRGYVAEERYQHSSAEYLDQHHKDVQLIHSDNGIHLDLHWSVSEPTFDSQLSSLVISPGASRVSLLNTSIAIQTPEDLLLFLSIHGLRHRWATLKWVCDLVSLFQSFPQLDWNAALAKARGVGREQVILLGVVLAGELSGQTFPTEVLARIGRYPALAILASQIREGHSTLDELPKCLSPEAVLGGVGFDSIRLLTRDRLSDRLKLFAEVMVDRIKPNSRDKLYLPIPAFAAPLHWIIRPFRLLQLYGVTCSLRSIQGLIIAVCGLGSESHAAMELKRNSSLGGQRGELI